MTDEALVGFSTSVFAFTGAQALKSPIKGIKTAMFFNNLWLGLIRITNFLSGFDFSQEIARRDGIALFHEPFRECAFLHRRGKRGHEDFNGHN